MDFGTDSALAARYKAEHAMADSAIKQQTSTIQQRFQDLKDRKKVLKLSMQDLVDRGYTPSFLVACGVSWKDLQRRHGASALVDFGFTWDQMRNSGVDPESACLLGLETLNITADQLMETGPSIENLASMRLPLHAMKDRGFTMEKLLALGLNAQNMNLFGYTLENWSKQFACDWKKLGFTTYKECEQFGWSRRDLHALNVCAKPSIEIKQARKTPRVSGSWEF